MPVIRLEPDTEETLNRHDFWRGCYLTMLAELKAKILRNILQSRLTDGRRDFKYREFKRDDDISLGQKKSNFKVRFYRLMDRMRENVPEVRIAKAARGRFSVDLEGAVELVKASG